VLVSILSGTHPCISTPENNRDMCTNKALPARIKYSELSPIFPSDLPGYSLQIASYTSATLTRHAVVVPSSN